MPRTLPPTSGSEAGLPAPHGLSTLATPLPLGRVCTFAGPDADAANGRVSANRLLLSEQCDFLSVAYKTCQDSTLQSVAPALSV